MSAFPYGGGHFSFGFLALSELKLFAKTHEIFQELITSNLLLEQ
jgi:hypothetical protein